MPLSFLYVLIPISLHRPVERIEAANVSTKRPKTMPPTANSQVPAKRSKAKQDPDIAKRLEHGPFIKALKHVETAFWETEKARGSVQSEKYKDQDTKAEIKDLKVQLTQATDELNAEKAGKIRLLRLNDELKIKLLNVQPQSQVTDSHIAEHYTLLRQNVSSWLDSEVRRFEVHWKTQHSGVSPQFDVLRDGSFLGHADFVKHGYRYGRHYLVESYILHQLHRLLFDVDKKFFVLGQHERALIESCEEGLLQLSPPRGKLVTSLNEEENAKVVIKDPAAIRYLSQLSAPKKKRKLTKYGEARSSPIDVEGSTDIDELVKTKKEEASSADEI
ncbi:MAG: hypothetical protein Q9204_005825 [Flavoplaca sp. TL-2023a]